MKLDNLFKPCFVFIFLVAFLGLAMPPLLTQISFLFGGPVKKAYADHCSPPKIHAEDKEGDPTCIDDSPPGGGGGGGGELPCGEYSMEGPDPLPLVATEEYSYKVQGDSESIRGSFSYSPTEPGEQNVPTDPVIETVECDGSSKTVEVQEKVVAVALKEIEGPTVGLSGEELTFSILTDPTGYEDDVDWTIDENSVGRGMEITRAFSATGDKELEAEFNVNGLEGNAEKHSVLIWEGEAEISPTVVPVGTSLSFSYKVTKGSEVVGEGEFSHPQFTEPGDQQVSQLVEVTIEETTTELEISEEITAVDISDPVVSGPSNVFTGDEVAARVTTEPGGYADMVHWRVLPGEKSGTGERATFTAEKEGTNTIAFWLEGEGHAGPKKTTTVQAINQFDVKIDGPDVVPKNPEPTPTYEYEIYQRDLDGNEHVVVEDQVDFPAGEIKDEAEVVLTVEEVDGENVDVAKKLTVVGLSGVEGPSVLIENEKGKFFGNTNPDGYTSKISWYIKDEQFGPSETVSAYWNSTGFKSIKAKITVNDMTGGKYLTEVPVVDCKLKIDSSGLGQTIAAKADKHSIFGGSTDSDFAAANTIYTAKCNPPGFVSAVSLKNKITGNLWYLVQAWNTSLAAVAVPDVFSKATSEGNFLSDGGSFSKSDIASLIFTGLPSPSPADISSDLWAPDLNNPTTLEPNEYLSAGNNLKLKAEAYMLGIAGAEGMVSAPLVENEIMEIEVIE